MFGPPREGVTLEYVIETIWSIFFNNIIIILINGLALFWPGFAQHVLTNYLGDILTAQKLRDYCTAFLGFHSFIGLLDLLDNFVLNNWVWDKTYDWDKELVLVTGGSSGIGQILVHNLAAKGILVASVDIQPPLKPLPAKAHFFKADITSPQAIRQAAEQIRERLGDPTVLINNAGIGTGETILDESDDALQRTFSINTIAHFHLVREFLPYMVKYNHGHVITIASMASFAVIANNVSYSCTKASALAFHEGLAQELKHRYKAPRVRTTIVHPFWTRTPLSQELTSDSAFNKLVLEPETVADAVVKQILKGESAQIILPWRFRILAPLLRGMPSWLQEIVRNSDKDLLDREAIARRRSAKM